MAKFYEIAQKNTRYYYLSVVSKNVQVFPDRKEENTLEKIANKYGGIHSGSGSCFLTGCRDYGYMFPTKQKAASFAKEAYEKKIIRAKVNIQEYVLEWDCDQGKEISVSQLSKI